MLIHIVTILVTLCYGAIGAYIYRDQIKWFWDNFDILIKKDDDK